MKRVCRYFSKGSIDVTAEVKNALNDRKPVIALESALITHGLPYPKNVETAMEMERIIRSHVISHNLCTSLHSHNIVCNSSSKSFDSVRGWGVRYARPIFFVLSYISLLV